MKEFSHKARLENIQKMQNETFDFVSVGGGINGAGIARDAVSRGMKVALVEAADFSSGTSSRSSKLIHGGIRYLENYEFKLVFEALNERTKLFEMAPHLVHPLRFMIPLYESSRVGMGLMGLGMWLYDALSLFQAPELHERLSAKSSLLRMPILKPQGLKGSFIYSDAYMDDDRLVHETLRAANEEGLIAANYCKAGALDFSNEGNFQALNVTDQLSKEGFKIKARHLICAAGPWTDELGQTFFKDWKKALRPTKGIHLTLSKDRLPLSSAVVMAAEKSDRIVFGIPRHEMVIVGTTDTDYSVSPSEVGADEKDVKYLLEIVNGYFPGAAIKEADIISSYAGVRPLVKDEAQSEGKTSREHRIWQDPKGITFVAGGKYTTYRLMSEQVVEKALSVFPVGDRVKFGNSQTNRPLSPFVEALKFHDTRMQIKTLAASFNCPLEDMIWLVDRYGAEAVEILERTQNYPGRYQKEAHQAIHHTMCLGLTDFMTRRVPLFLADPMHGLAILESVVEVFSKELDWSQDQMKFEIQKYKDYISKELAWKHN
ncbi:MAG: glycerol-3-phosphate dehydrogenase/oxidase [Bdellovibrionales bacterium]